MKEFLNRHAGKLILAVFIAIVVLVWVFGHETRAEAGTGIGCPVECRYGA